MSPVGTRLPKPRATRPHMPGYGLPRGTRGLLPWKWAEDRLKKSHIYWIATTRPDGRPHLMVVWGFWKDGRFLFSTGSQSRKAKNLASNRRCIIATEQANQAVIVEGVAEILADVELRRWFLAQTEKKYKFDMSAFAEDILNLTEPVYTVHPDIVFGLDEKKSLKSATRWHFRQ